MSDKHDERVPDEKKYWLDANADKVWWGLVAVCALLIVVEIPLWLLHYRHGYFTFDGFPIFFGAFGFAAFFGIVMAGKYLRKVLSRPEDYYDSGGAP